MCPPASVAPGPPWRMFYLSPQLHLPSSSLHLQSALWLLAMNAPPTRTLQMAFWGYFSSTFWTFSEGISSQQHLSHLPSKMSHELVSQPHLLPERTNPARWDSDISAASIQLWRQPCSRMQPRVVPPAQRQPESSWQLSATRKISKGSTNGYVCDSKVADCVLFERSWPKIRWEIATVCLIFYTCFLSLLLFNVSVLQQL